MVGRFATSTSPLMSTFASGGRAAQFSRPRTCHMSTRMAVRATAPYALLASPQSLPWGSGTPRNLWAHCRRCRLPTWQTRSARTPRGRFAMSSQVITGRGGRRLRELARDRRAIFVPVRTSSGASMSSDLPIQCACGELRGFIHDLSPNSSNRIVCYCSMFQQYAADMGRGDEVLDEHSGTDLLQVSWASLRFTEGAEHLTCKQLSPGGSLRWYAACCDSPIANTLDSRQLPSTGVVHTCLRPSGLGRSLDALVGPVRAGVNGNFAPELARSLKTTRWDTLALAVSAIPMVLRWRWRGDHLRSPFPIEPSGPTKAPPN